MKKFFSMIPGWGWGVLIVLALAAPVPVVSVLEERDPFCISCHTAPEQAYYERAQQALNGQVPSIDLASAHYGGEAFRCIDCHRGDGAAADRMRTLGLGARDTLIWLGGQADPRLEKLATGQPELVERSCIVCHTESLLVAGFNDHFHNMLPAAFRAWEAGAELTAPPDLPDVDMTSLTAYETSVTCLDCHHAHRHLPGSEFQYYLDINEVVFPACVQCHQEVEKGPMKTEELGG